MPKPVVLLLLSVIAVGATVAAVSATSLVLGLAAVLMWVGTGLLARLPWVPGSEHGSVFRRAVVAIGAYLGGLVVFAVGLGGLD